MALELFGFSELDEDNKNFNFPIDHGNLIVYAADAERLKRIQYEDTKIRCFSSRNTKSPMLSTSESEQAINEATRDYKIPTDSAISVEHLSTTSAATPLEKITHVLTSKACKYNSGIARHK